MSGSNVPPSLNIFSNGIGSVTDKQLNGMLQSTPQATDLRLFTGLTNMSAFVQVPTGFFAYFPASTAADDGVDTIAPQGQTAGRWLRMGFRSVNLTTPIISTDTIDPLTTGILTVNAGLNVLDPLTATTITATNSLAAPGTASFNAVAGNNAYFNTLQAGTLVTGGTPTPPGDLLMGGHNITNVGTLTASVLDATSCGFNAVQMFGTINMSGTNDITNGRNVILSGSIQAATGAITGLSTTTFSASTATITTLYVHSTVPTVMITGEEPQTIDLIAIRDGIAKLTARVAELETKLGAS
jgi:hypothetical protein